MSESTTGRTGLVAGRSDLADAVKQATDAMDEILRAVSSAYAAGYDIKNCRGRRKLVRRG